MIKTSRRATTSDFYLELIFSHAFFNRKSQILLGRFDSWFKCKKLFRLIKASCYEGRKDTYIIIVLFYLRILKVVVVHLGGVTIYVSDQPF